MTPAPHPTANQPGGKMTDAQLGTAIVFFLGYLTGGIVMGILIFLSQWSCK